MLTGTANAVVRRLGDKVFQLYPAISNRETADDGTYHLYYDFGSCHISRTPDNAVRVRIIIPLRVGTRYIAHSAYFQNSGNAHVYMWFEKVIHLEGEEEELTSHTLELVALYHVRDAEQ